MNYLKRTTRTLLCTAGLLASALLAACGSGDAGRDAILGLDAATIVSVAVTPASSTIPLAATQQLVATATYSDGSSADVTAKAAWSSATPAVASVASATGLATGVSSGSAVLTATYSGKAGSASVTVSAATLQTLALTPATASVASGAPLQYSASGTYSDGTTRDLTASAVFTSSSTGNATIAASGGLASGVSAGTATITATSGGLSASATLTVTAATLSSITLTPATATLAVGATQQLTVLATYSDGSSVNVTAASSYVSATPAIAAVNAGSGLATGIAAGTAIISATFNGQGATSTLTVVPVVALSTIAVTPANATIAVGSTQQLVATGTYADGSSAVITSSVTWSSASTAVATVNGSGLSTGVSAGSALITASLGSQSGSATLAVTAVSTALNLRSASTFGVLSASSITNNSGGTTIVTGNVGAPSETVEPPHTAGYNNYTSGAVLDTALSDLQLAITDANSRACTVTVTGNADLSSAVFSSNATLAPGVYCVTGNITIGANLTLDGSGFYLFRAGATLDSVANVTIALTNGATAGNVFWVPVGATTLGANGSFQGSVLGQSAAITVGANTTLQNGRVLSGGAVTLNNNPIAIP